MDSMDRYVPYSVHSMDTMDTMDARGHYGLILRFSYTEGVAWFGVRFVLRHRITEGDSA
jgi:hypothetical protein